MATNVHICGICEIPNRTSVCSACINPKLNEKYKLLNTTKRDRDFLHKRLDEKLNAERTEAVEQRNWREIHTINLAQLKATLRLKQKQLSKQKSELEEETKELHTRERLLDEASAVLESNKTEQLKQYSDLISSESSRLKTLKVELWETQSEAIKQVCKVFPLGQVLKSENKDEGPSTEHYYNQICDISLPRGLNPKSVTPQELAVSLGYMVQLLNLAAQYLYAPLLLDNGFAGSYSRVWQRTSYWDSRAAASHETNLLFIPGENFSEQASTSESSSNIDFSSRDLNMSVQQGIHLLKRAVACVTAYCCNLLSIPSSEALSTFEAFEKILTFISSKDKSAAISLSSKSFKKSKSRNTSQEKRNPITNSLLCSSEMAADLKKTERKKVNGCDVVEPTLPPQPSNPEEVEQWNRANKSSIK